MTDPPLDDTVQARMQGIRCEIDQDLEDVSASARSMVDWKHYVKDLSVGLLGGGGRAGVSGRSQTIRGDRRRSGCPDRTGKDRPSGRQFGADRHAEDWSMTLVTPSSASRFARQSPTSAQVAEETVTGNDSSERSPRTNHHDSTSNVLKSSKRRHWLNPRMGSDHGEGVDMARKRPSRIGPVDRPIRGSTARFLPGGGTIRRSRTGMVGETTMNHHNGSSHSAV